MTLLSFPIHLLIYLMKMRAYLFTALLASGLVFTACGKKADAPANDSTATLDKKVDSTPAATPTVATPTTDPAKMMDSANKQLDKAMDTAAKALDQAKDKADEALKDAKKTMDSLKK